MVLLYIWTRVYSEVLTSLATVASTSAMNGKGQAKFCSGQAHFIQRVKLNISSLKF